MALMIPSTLEHMPDTTAGERKLFGILRRHLPDTSIVRYEVLLGERDRRPDYIVIDPDRGIAIIEIKDWGIGNITKATAHNFLVRGYGGSPVPKPQLNPDSKCQIYLREARSQLVAMPALCDADSRLRVPIVYFVAFPNISAAEFDGQELGQVMSRERVLFSEDLAATGSAFLKRYAEALPQLESRLTSLQLAEITRALFPDIAIPHVTPGFIQTTEEVVSTTSDSVDLYTLSLDQELIAKSLGEGPRLLRGIAGTGKTLIMLYRAKMLAANDATGSLRILILCWNVSLANYMRQAYDKLQFVARSEVAILNFSQFASRLFADHRRPVENVDSLKFQASLDDLDIAESEKYDAIYVDEAQDFRKEWIAYLYHRLLKGPPDKRNLLVAADDAQRIYSKRDFRWGDLGIPMGGRSKILKTIYRNSARVWTFSAFLLEEKASYVYKGSEDPSRVEFSAKGGYDPQIVECPNLQAQIDKAVDTIQAMARHGYAWRNVLILYRSQTVDGFPLVERLTDRLDQAGIKRDVITENRSTFDWHADTVKISTVHSAKGMDSPIVILLGAEAFNPDFSSGEDDTRLMYVALTRAREFLMVLHSGEGGLVPQLQHCQQEYEKYLPAIVQIEEDGAG